MSRTTPEWIGKSDDEPVPPRVRVRVFEKYGGICAECGVRIRSGPWVCDHRIALINGGANRERNLQPIHGRCDKAKTKRDVAIKSKNYRVRLRHLGLERKGKRKLPGSRGSPIKMKIGGGWEYR
jgi:5-methylcytosine-specific restriction endonuclease McrA